MKQSSLLLPFALLVVILLLVFFIKREAVAFRGSTQALPQTSGADVSPQAFNPDERVIDIYDRVSPSVVSVANKALMRSWFSPQIVEVPQGSGSGFVWDENGHILSNYHVVHEADALTVTFPDGQTFDARVVGAAPDFDLAVLKIEAGTRALHPIQAGTSRDLRVGQSVLAIGNPFGLDTSLSKGIVSALGRTMLSMSQRRISDVIQTDAAINPGNSGGPLLDLSGRLIGINTAIYSPSGANAGIGFAVPVDTISRIAPQLIAHGRITRAGIGVQLLPDALTRRGRVEGVGVAAPLPGSPAERAGIEGVRQLGWGSFALGDVVTAVNGRAVKNTDDLRDILDALQPGDIVELTLLKNGESRALSIALVEAR
jgi:S1-C subfamily serine protease